MTSNSFRALCKAMSREIGCAEPTLAEGDGRLFVDVRAGERDVQLIYFPERDPESVHVLVTLGRVQGELELPLVLSLMTANFNLIAEGLDPAYSRNPGTGELQYQCRNNLAGLDAREFLLQLCSIAEVTESGFDGLGNQPPGADGASATVNASSDSHAA